MSRLNLTTWQRHRLRRQLKQTLDARLLRRTLAVLELDQGRSAADVARMLGVTRQSIYNWVEAYTQGHDPEALRDEAGRGRHPSLDEDDERLLQSLLALSPQELGCPHVSWTVPLLQEFLKVGAGRRVSEDTVRRALHRLDYAWKRPRHDLGPDPRAREKNGASGGKSGPCRGAAWCWPRTRPTCCSSRRCAPAGPGAARSPGSG